MLPYFCLPLFLVDCVQVIHGYTLVRVPVFAFIFLYSVARSICILRTWTGRSVAGQLGNDLHLYPLLQAYHRIIFGSQ